MSSKDSSAAKSFPSASPRIRPPRSSRTSTITAASKPWLRTTPLSATRSPASRTNAQTVKKLQPQEVATAQFQETTAFLNGVRQNLARHGVANLEAIELGLRAALFQDGRALLEALYRQPDLRGPDNASGPGEKCHADRAKDIHRLFGTIAVHRHYFYQPERQTGRLPLDQALGLVQSFSPALVRLCARAAAKEGYESASEDLWAQAGVVIEGRQIQ
jgi:hypothetical protein